MLAILQDVWHAAEHIMRPQTIPQLALVIRNAEHVQLEKYGRLKLTGG